MHRKQLILALLVMVGFVMMVSIGAALAADQTVTGIVEKTAQGIVLSADDGNSYMIQGQDLSKMVGKSVKATGTLEEGKTGKIINVIKFEELKEMKE